MPAPLQLLMVAIFGFAMLNYLALLAWGVLSFRSLGARRASTRETALRRTHAVGPGVSVIMPAYNEENVIAQTVTCALAQDYPEFEVIVVNDGSTDETLKVLVKEFDLVPVSVDPTAVGHLPTRPVHEVLRSRRDPRLYVVDKDAAGAKADNSNVGVNLAHYGYVVVMDADELMQPDVLALCMTEVVASGYRPIGVGSTLLPSNDILVEGSVVRDARVPSGYWVGCQLVEYLTAFLLTRPGMAALRALPIISGGFGLFNRDALLRAGGYRAGHLGEDMDMCVRLHRWHRENDWPYLIRQVPEAIVWTEFPPTHAVLRRQRIRWHRGLRMIMSDHHRTVGNPRYGAFGLGMAGLFVFEWLGPLVETVGYLLLVVLLALGLVNPWAALGVFGVTQALGLLVSFTSVSLLTGRLGVFGHRGDLRRLFGWCLAQQFGYRQLTVWWRIRSLLPGKLHWGEMPRLGFKTSG